MRVWGYELTGREHVQHKEEVLQDVGLCDVVHTTLVPSHT